MKTFKEIGKFPTKTKLNQEEDHYYDLCLFQGGSLYKNVVHISPLHKSQYKTIKGDCRMF